MIKKITETEFVLCCGGACPHVKLQDEQLSITDDFGGAVTLSIEEAKDLSEALTVLCP